MVGVLTSLKTRISGIASLASANLRYNILPWLYVQGQIGMDYYTRNNNFLVPQGTGYLRGGSKSETANFVREINQEWILGGADHEFGKFRVNAFVGGNKMVRESEAIGANGSSFHISRSLHRLAIPNPRTSGIWLQ